MHVAGMKLWENNKYKYTLETYPKFDISYCREIVSVVGILISDVYRLNFEYFCSQENVYNNF